MTATAHRHDPQELYRCWEHEQWNRWSIDLATDRSQWQSALSDEDEARHMQCYARFQNEVIAEPAAIAAHVQIRRKSLELSPAVASALAPRDGGDTDREALDAGSDEICAFALDGLTRRLNVIGVALGDG